MTAPFHPPAIAPTPAPTAAPPPAPIAVRLPGVAQATARGARRQKVRYFRMTTPCCAALERLVRRVLQTARTTARIPACRGHFATTPTFVATVGESASFGGRANSTPLRAAGGAGAPSTEPVLFAASRPLSRHARRVGSATLRGNSALPGARWKVFRSTAKHAKQTRIFSGVRNGLEDGLAALDDDLELDVLRLVPLHQLRHLRADA